MVVGAAVAIRGVVVGARDAFALGVLCAIGV